MCPYGLCKWLCKFCASCDPATVQILVQICEFLRGFLCGFLYELLCGLGGILGYRFTSVGMLNTGHPSGQPNLPTCLALAPILEP